VGTLSSSSDKTFAVLNNHGPDGTVTNKTYIYDDSNQQDIPGAQHTSGPGSLHDWAGKQIGGGTIWTFTEVDNALNHVGSLSAVYVFVEPQPDLTQGILVTIQPGACVEEFVQVPDD